MVTTATLGEQTILDWLPAAMTIIGVIALGILIAISVRSRRQPLESPASGDLDSTRQSLEELKSSAGALLEDAQRVAQQLDAKADRLELLIRAADERLAGLETGSNRSSVAIPGAGPGAGEEAEAGAGVEVTMPAQRTMENKPSAEDRLDPLTRSIHQLADEGRTPVEIARALKEDIGKVQLILALRVAG